MAVKTRQELLDYWNSKIIQNSNQAITGQIMNQGGVDIIDSMAMGTDASNAMNWKNKWAAGTYNINDVVRDGDWTMVANKTTTERPAPQLVGDPIYLFPGTLNGVGSPSASQVIVGQRYTPPVDKLITGFRIYTDAGQKYGVYIVTDPTGTPQFNQVASFTATTTGWVAINTSNVFIDAGEAFDLIATINPDNTPTNTNATYVYTTPQNTAVPLAGQIIHANNAIDELWISTTDNNATDRSALLASLKLGDVIVSEGQSWTVQGNTNAGTYHIIQVVPTIQLVVDGTFTFQFQVYPVATILRQQATDEWPGDPEVSGLLAVDTGYDTIVPDDNQYNVDIQYQDIRFSDDWDILAFSGQQETWEPDYNFEKVSAFTVTSQQPTYDTVARLPINIPAGLTTYEIKFSWTYTLNSTVNSAYFRFSIDDGATWSTFQEEPKDITDQRPRYYAFPRTYNEENVVQSGLVFEAAKGNVSDVMTIDFLDVIFQKVQ